MALSKKQEKQVRRQIKGNQHSTHNVDITLARSEILEGFSVYRNILNLEKVAALHLARYLFFNNDLYNGKTVIDIGCGSGIQGIVTFKYGSKKTVCSDISKDAVKNTLENIKQYGLEEKMDVVQGDLFENIDSKADLIVFNHPFFAANPYQEFLVSLAMLNKGELIHRFLDNSKEYLISNGRIVMPYFSIAGKINDPLQQGRKHGFEVELKFKFDEKKGLQRGDILIYELGLK